MNDESFGVRPVMRFHERALDFSKGNEVGTMQRKIIWTGGLAASVLAVAIAVRAADSNRPIAVRGTADEGGLILLDEIDCAMLEPAASNPTVRTQYPVGDPRNNDVLAGVPEPCVGESKKVYSATLGQLLFRPQAGNRVADDIITELVRPCSLCSFSIRVTGGVENGEGEFLAEVELYDGCPDVNADGEPIPGTRKLYMLEDDDIGTEYDLMIPFGDRGICADGAACLVSEQDCGGGVCDDGSACDLAAPDCQDGLPCLPDSCEPDPLEIPAEIWVRIRFNTDDAAILVGTPPRHGFSADSYDDVFGTCRNYFGGYPTCAHATFYTEVYTPPECETHFLAYLAANPVSLAFLPTALPGASPTTRLADDITLAVPYCILSAYELGVKGSSGNYTLVTDMRWPEISDVVPETENVFPGRGESGSLEIAHTTIPHDVDIAIQASHRPLFLSWQADRENTGVVEVGVTQLGTSRPQFFVFDLPPYPGAWSIAPYLPGNRGTFYAAVFCRGEEPRGACCGNQPDILGADIECLDDVPASACPSSRWLPGTTCAENLFDPPCGTSACCLPDNSTEYLFFDECRDACIVDEAPITCFPVCDGGVNEGLPCDPDGDGTDCPSASCDPDGKCPGERTCGLTGCMLAGEFTGRPCDPDNPKAGASDCMTCSGIGEYCRPRCVGGTRSGRDCDPTDAATCPGDDTADPPIPAGICDTDFDCPGSETCEVHGQTCATDPNQCGLRCARWNPDEFDSDNGFECPNFACFDAEGSCLEDEEEIPCFGRCEGDPKVPCRFDSECASNRCLDSNADCPDGRACTGSPLNVCHGRAGCDHFECCADVCSYRPVCCESGVGQGWNLLCAVTAENLCNSPPENDECWSESPGEGATEIELSDDDTGLACTLSSTSCSAAKLALNTNATANFPDDPEVCCSATGVNQRVQGTIWFKFEAVHESARIHTCGSPDNWPSVDSVIQVFEANNVTPNGDDFDECNSLEVIGCNDDSGCGITGEQASVCVTRLIPGETYFVMMGSKRGENLGRYSIELQTPCPIDMLPQPGDECEFAVPIGVGQTPFDLEGASIDCPAEPMLPGMVNDLWFEVPANFCDGPSVLTVQTCGYDLDPAEPNPDTTLAVYSGSECPPTLLAGANDDATVSPVCTIPVDDGDGLGFRDCATDADCNRGCRILKGPCLSDENCIGTDTCDTNPLAKCQTKLEGEGPSSEVDCVLDGDCTRGVCEGGVAECNTSTYTHLRCPSGDPCATSADCTEFGACEPECGYLPNSNKPRPCIAQEECVPGSCQSQCTSASFVQVPAVANQSFLIRVGGEFRTEPAGTLRAECVRDDCNENGIPDLLDIANGIQPDCNLNGEPDSCDLHDTGISSDCNCNEIPDECEIDAAIPINCTGVPGPCEAGPFFCNSFDCDDDSNANGIPDCCDAVVPPATCADCCVVADDLVDVVFAESGSSLNDDQAKNCAIDAREPHDIDNAANRNGWDRMVMSFSCDPSDISLDPGDFTVQVVPAGTAPQVSSIVIDSVGNTATVVLNEKIAPGRWTCIGHPNSGNQWCMGYLPADANQDGLSAASDINALIDSMNRIPGAERPTHATDIDRSGTTNTQDLLRLVDLLNGAGEFSQWLARELPPCPSASDGRSTVR